MSFPTYPSFNYNIYYLPGNIVQGLSTPVLYQATALQPNQGNSPDIQPNIYWDVYQGGGGGGGGGGGTVLSVGAGFGCQLTSASTPTNVIIGTDISAVNGLSVFNPSGTQLQLNGPSLYNVDTSNNSVLDGYGLEYITDTANLTHLVLSRTSSKPPSTLISPFYNNIYGNSGIGQIGYYPYTFPPNPSPLFPQVFDFPSYFLNNPYSSATLGITVAERNTTPPPVVNITFNETYPGQPGCAYSVVNLVSFGGRPGGNITVSITDNTASAGTLCQFFGVNAQSGGNVNNSATYTIGTSTTLTVRKFLMDINNTDMLTVSGTGVAIMVNLNTINYGNFNGIGN